MPKALAPWDGISPFVASFPSEPANRPYLLRPDIFHSFHLGISRYFLASALVVLQQFTMLFPGGGVDARFCSMTALWIQYCRSRRDTLSYF